MKNCSAPMKSVLKTSLIICILALASCGKKWKEPTQVTFRAQLANSGSGPVHFTSGSIVLDKVTFTGEREQGENHVNIEKPFEPVQLPLENNSSGYGVSLDVPQGTYNDIDITIETNSQLNGSCILLTGYYINSNNDSICVQFNFKASDQYKIKAKPSGGKSEIVLVSGDPTSCVIMADPGYWFG